MNASLILQNHLGPQPVAELYTPQDAVRETMTKRITAIMAAGIVSAPNFPAEDLLPKVSPPPFTNHGHMLLLDYSSMLKTVWQLIGTIQKTTYAFVRRRLLILMGSLLLAVVLGFVVGGYLGNDYFVVAVVIGGMSFLTFYQLGKWKFIVPLRSTIADIRARAIRDLLDGNVPLSPIREDINRKVGEELHGVGNGDLGKSDVPVLTIANDGHPFPGYGRLQVDSTYVCPPKEKKRLPVTILEVRKNISKSIKEFVDTSGIGDVTFGEVLVLYGRSLTADNPILQEQIPGEKVPPLWYDAAKLDELDSGADAYSRVYFAIQILFPQHMTVATFFTRPFLAGNAIAYQVAMSTLGPPIKDIGNLMTQLNQYELEKSGERLVTATSVNRGLGYLRTLRTIVRSGQRFQSLSVDRLAIEKLQISSSEYDQDLYREEVSKVARESVFWPGNYAQLRNWREDNSFTFTTHFFGRPEAQASVRTLYVQISKAVLDGLDSLGYDTSAYRDDKGSYSINAEKIDQLVVGEKIYVPEQHKDKAASSETESTSAKKA